MCKLQEDEDISTKHSIDTNLLQNWQMSENTQALCTNLIKGMAQKFKQ